MMAPNDIKRIQLYDGEGWLAETRPIGWAAEAASEDDDDLE